MLLVAFPFGDLARISTLRSSGIRILGRVVVNQV